MCFLTLVLTIILPFTHAQVGTVTQQITTFSAFPSQKACARDCFIETGFCRNDVLGSKIGCAEHTDCAGPWLATNSCYCRTDLQAVAQSYLTACVEKACDEGDVAIDASSAGSIYSNYCVEKGFPAVAPVPIDATTTGKGAGKTTTGSLIAQSTASSTAQGGDSSSRKLSTTTIIGIAVGGAIALLLVIVMITKIIRRNNPPQQQQHYPPPVSQEPFYPPNPYPEIYYPPPVPRSEVYPEDSVSMVSGMPPPAPTLVSAGPGYPQRY